MCLEAVKYSVPVVCNEAEVQEGQSPAWCSLVSMDSRDPRQGARVKALGAQRPTGRAGGTCWGGPAALARNPLAFQPLPPASPLLCQDGSTLSIALLASVSLFRSIPEKPEALRREAKPSGGSGCRSTGGCRAGHTAFSVGGHRACCRQWPLHRPP